MESLHTKQAHWEQVYTQKPLETCSWYQATPQLALDLLKTYQISPSDRIIDVGGGDSFLVDHLLDLGYSHLNVLDISAKAILRAQKRLGAKAKQVSWVTSDILDFAATQTYDFWYDRAAFHFLTTESEVQKYVQLAAQGIKAGGILVIGTFSLDGPQKCSGLEVRQYSEKSLAEVFEAYFQKIDCFPVEHYTPTQAVQHFTFCVFRKK